MSIEVGGEAATEEWLGHRPGQLLKYLVCERGRVVPLEELLEVFWPHAGRAGASSVRQAIHTLRDRLEPERPRGKPSGYVVARAGGYELAPGRVAIDADDFEARARAGLQELQAGATERAEQTLAAAARAYGGTFLADEPYAEWALAERERLRDLAVQVLRGLAGICRDAGEEDAAAEHLQQLVELEPLDLEAQRELLTLMLRRGRHSEALRRYDLIRRRYKRTFGAEPPFDAHRVDVASAACWPPSSLSLSSLSWGLSDFLGGFQSRRHALLAVLVLSQGLALAILIVAVLAGAPTSTTRPRRCGRRPSAGSACSGSWRSTARSRSGR